MRYLHPLPDGLVEPEPFAVDVEALEQLVGILFREWSDDRILVEAEYHAALAVGPSGDHVAPKDVLLRRGAERASDLLRGIWDGRQELADYRATKEGPNPRQPPANEA